MKLLCLIASSSIIILLSACATDTRNPKVLYISDSDIYFVDSQKLSAKIFNEYIDNAVSGDDDSLRHIISLSLYTDGEGSLSFGDKLLQLKKVVGSTRFKKALYSVSEQARKSAMIDMEAALKMRKFAQKTN